jgi:hypothetical protein
MNHTTTTVMIAIVGIAATLLAAGTIAAAVGSEHSAFAHHKKGDYKGQKETRSNAISQGAINKQIILCITYGMASPILTGACTNTGTAHDDNSGGIIAFPNPASSPMKRGSSYTTQQSMPMKPSTTTTTSTPNLEHTSSPMKQGSSYTPYSTQQSMPMKPSTTTTTSTPNLEHTSSPMKSSTTRIDGSYPSVALMKPSSSATTTSTPNLEHTSSPMKSSTTSTPLKFNAPIKIPFDLPG